MTLEYAETPQTTVTEAAYFADQVAMEVLFSKYQAVKCIKREFVDANFPAALADAEIHVEFALDALAQLVLHKRANIPTLVGLLMKHFSDDEYPAQACADELLKLAANDFVDWDSQGEKMVLKYNVTTEIQDKLDILQYPMPMIQPPEPVTSNSSTGYVTIQGSIILKKNHHNDDVCLDHINRVNKVPLTLNHDVVKYVQNQWKNHKHQKPDEPLEKYQKRCKAFQKYDRSSKDVLEALMVRGNRFWLTHKYDKRGRTYCQGYHVTYQGNDWNKSCIEFADGEITKLE